MFELLKHFSVKSQTEMKTQQTDYPLLVVRKSRNVEDTTGMGEPADVMASRCITSQDSALLHKHDADEHHPVALPFLSSERERAGVKQYAWFISAGLLYSTCTKAEISQ